MIDLTEDGRTVTEGRIITPDTSPELEERPRLQRLMDVKVEIATLPKGYLWQIDQRRQQKIKNEKQDTNPEPQRNEDEEQDDKEAKTKEKAKVKAKAKSLGHIAMAEDPIDERDDELARRNP